MSQFPGLQYNTGFSVAQDAALRALPAPKQVATNGVPVNARDVGM